MADDAVKTRIRDVLAETYFNQPGELVDVSEGPDGGIHIVVVSRRLNGRRMKEKHDLIWSVLTERLSPDEWGKVTLSVGVSPEDIKALT